MLGEKCENCLKKNHILINCSFCHRNICLKCKEPVQGLCVPEGNCCIEKEDYVKNFKERLKKNMPVVQAVKILKI